MFSRLLLFLVVSSFLLRGTTEDDECYTTPRALVRGFSATRTVPLRGEHPDSEVLCYILMVIYWVEIPSYTPSL